MRAVTQIFIQRRPFMERVDVWIQVISILEGTAKRSVATNLQMRDLAECEDAAPSLSIREEEAQFLIDELYRAGFRPSDQPNTASALTATNHHLRDMRAIVAKTTGVVLP